jgi:hypothetical protein
MSPRSNELQKSSELSLNKSVNRHFVPNINDKEINSRDTTDIFFESSFTLGFKS